LKRLQGLGKMMKDSTNFWSQTFETITACKTERDSNCGDEYFEVKKDVIEDYDTRSTQPRTESGDNRSYIKNEEDDISKTDTVSKISLTSKKWTLEEDNMLLTLIKNSRKRDWKAIGSSLNKTSSQCSYRYSKLTNLLKKSKWSRKEDLLLIELVELYGENWQYIQTKIPHKSVEDIRLRYIITLDPTKRKPEKVDELINIKCENLTAETQPSHKRKLSAEDLCIFNQNFEDECKNIFVNKRKDSYDINFSDQFLQKNHNEDLLRQYHLLENVFQQVYEFTNNCNILASTPYDKTIEQKKHMLSNKLNSLKEYYISIMNRDVYNADAKKKSLISQIEVLIELINTIKLRILMIQGGKVL
jgi:hypothetical protein